MDFFRLLLVIFLNLAIYFILRIYYDNKSDLKRRLKMLKISPYFCWTLLFNTNICFSQETNFSIDDNTDAQEDIITSCKDYALIKDYESVYSSYVKNGDVNAKVLRFKGSFAKESPIFIPGNGNLYIRVADLNNKPFEIISAKCQSQGFTADLSASPYEVKVSKQKGSSATVLTLKLKDLKGYLNLNIALLDNTKTQYEISHTLYNINLPYYLQNSLDDSTNGANANLTLIQNDANTNSNFNSNDSSLDFIEINDDGSLNITLTNDGELNITNIENSKNNATTTDSNTNDFSPLCQSSITNNTLTFEEIQKSQQNAIYDLIVNDNKQ